MSGARPSEEPLRLGIVGLGKAAQLLLPTFLDHPSTDVVGVTDIDVGRAAALASTIGAQVHSDLDSLLADHRIDAVYVATPHQFHAEQAVLALSAGKHVLVEKPMALTPDDCDAMVSAAARSGRALVVGHTHGTSPGVLLARRIVRSGDFGRMRMLLSFNYTDYLYRPRRPEELDTQAGGGAIFNQLPHQVDVARTIEGEGRIKSVRAGAWVTDAARPTEGRYTTLLHFAGGAVATLAYSGHGYFDSDEWYGWVAESGRPKDPAAHRETWNRIQGEASDRPAHREAGTPGGSASQELLGSPHFGVSVVSLDQADLVLRPDGVLVCSADGQHLVPHRGVGTGKTATVDELVRAARGLEAPLHDGVWGRHTVETCLGVLRSAQTQQEVYL
jgi:phthalate 4,5-cis-dihydrodiol dehydrogenase